MVLQEVSPRTLRPTVGSYLVFCGAWIVLGSLYVFLAWSRPGVGAWKGATITFASAFAAVLWISGHRIRIGGGMLHYRNGFFHSRSIALSDIKTIVHVWEPVITLGREIKVPRLRVCAHDQALSFSINSKPFSREALAELQRLNVSQKGNRRLR
ncbi:MAG TPA: hypothetical protein VHP33_11640 [Polyangiaceae bacterium]|nr:hypothetical protein [Polyangiaceae bacterium]